MTSEAKFQGQVPLNPLTMVLLGHTGVGKSTTGNTILQFNAFEQKGTFTSVTMKISEQSGKVGGQEVLVVDTPGIFGSQKEITEYCQKLIKSNKNCVFLYVLNIDRFTEEQEKAIKTAMSAVGDEGLGRGMLLFTGADSLKNSGLTLEQFIHQDPRNPLVSLVQEFGDRFHAFDNSLSSAEQNQEQVQELMRKIHLTTSDHLKSPRRLEEVRLVLLGRPGAGKSSTGNSILGIDVFDNGCDFDPVTAEAIAESAEVFGRQVTVVDTPGFNPKHMTLQCYFKQLVWSVLDTEPGPNAFVIVLPIDRILDADFLFFEVFSLLFDKDLTYFTVVFTNGDRLKKKSIEELISTNPLVKDLVSRCRGRYTVFNNNIDLCKNRSQVQNLLKNIDEIHSENEGRPYTLKMLFQNNNLVLESPVSVDSLNDIELESVDSIDLESEEDYGGNCADVMTAQGSIDTTEPTVTQYSTDPTEPTVTQYSTDPTEPTVTQYSTDPTEPTVTQYSTDPTEPTVTQYSTDPTDPTVTQCLTDPTEPTVTQGRTTPAGRNPFRTLWKKVKAFFERLLTKIKRFSTKVKVLYAN